MKNGNHLRNLPKKKIEWSFKRICSQINLLSAPLAKSGPFDFPQEKGFLFFFFFAHEKGLEHIFQE